MPAPVMFAHRLLLELAAVRKSPAGKKLAPWLRPDCKSQVAVAYKDGVPAHIENVVVSTQHAAAATHAQIEKFIIEKIIRKVLPAALLSKQTQFLVNPTGRFVVGGPQGDSGLTGRKIIVDTYGGAGRHGGGAFSGKDPSKVDRSAAYLSRWVAKHIVAAGLARRVELQTAYAIGHPRPTSICVNTFGTGVIADAQIVAAIQKVFSFKPADIVKQLNLLQPIYRRSTHYGHFTKPDLPWENLTRLAQLKKAAKDAAR
jgi:S-adenosylmethionine synthetase